jgi:hypothetical protein
MAVFSAEDSEVLIAIDLKLLTEEQHQLNYGKRRNIYTGYIRTYTGKVSVENYGPQSICIEDMHTLTYTINLCWSFKSHLVLASTHSMLHSVPQEHQL